MQVTRIRPMARVSIECDRGFPVADAVFTGWLDDDGARALRSVLLDCLAEAPGAIMVDLGDAGHINAASGLGTWAVGYGLLQRLRTAQ